MGRPRTPFYEERRAVVADGRIDIMCQHNEQYEAADVPEEGFVALTATCGQGCSDLTLVGTGAPVGMRTFLGGTPVAR